MFFKVLSTLQNLMESSIKFKFIIHSKLFDSAAKSSFSNISIFNKICSEIKAFF